MGRIVAMGEVVADIYREEGPSPVELPFIARPGGAPANVAVAASKLGAEAMFLGSVGEDLFGEFILRALKSEGVDTSAVVRQSAPTRTSLAFVEISEAGDRSFTFYRSSPAADELLAPEDIGAELLSGASFLNFGSIPLIKGPARSAILHAADLAEEMEVPIAFDMNFREHLWESIEAARETIEPLMDRSSLMKLGGDEIEPLFGTEDPEEVARELFGRGVALVLVSRGERGAFYATPEFQGEVPALKVEAVDTTGAGDAFLAAALVHLADRPWNEETVREATRRGTAAGSLACAGYGAMGSLPTQKELERFMSGGG